MTNRLRSGRSNRYLLLLIDQVEKRQEKSSDIATNEIGAKQPEPDYPAYTRRLLFIIIFKGTK